MLPKDYIAYMLTGSFCTDVSDASGMLLFDVEHKCWSKEMMQICGVTDSQLAKIYESYAVVGTLKPEVAAELGLPETVKVAAGAGDNAAAAIGTAQSVTACAIFHLVRAGQYLYPAKISELTRTMPFIPLRMLMVNTI